MAHQEALDEDGSLLPHAVSPVAGLVFHGGIPPRIEMENVACAGQVQASTARFETDEEQGGAFAGLEGFHEFLALLLRGAAVQAQEVDAGGFEVLLQLVQRLGKLAEHEGAVAFGLQFFGLVEQVLELGGHLGMVGINQGWGNTDLTQAGERGQGDDASLLRGLVLKGCEHLLAHLAHGTGVEALLLLAQVQVQVAGDLGRQFLEDFVLGAAQHEGLRAVERIEDAVGLFHRVHERLEIAEQAGHGQVNDAVVFAHVVLHGRAGEHQLEAALQLAHGLAALTTHVLYVLRFVENHAVELRVAQRVDIPSRNVVGGDDHSLPDADQAAALAGVFVHRQSRAEDFHLVLPVE